MQRLVGNQLRIVDIRFDKPDPTVLEIGKKFSVLLRVEFPSPKNLCRIDFRPVVHPLVMQVVVFLIAHKDKVLAGSMGKSFGDGRAARISLASPLQRIADLA